jgi:hypothetical protein
MPIDLPLLRRLLPLAALLCAVTAMPAAMAASSASSSASDSASTSVGSLSTSLETSSGSSTTNKDVAQGDYRVTDVAAVPERPGTVRLKLQAVARPGPAGELLLYLPEATAEQGGLAPGHVITARHRPYGVEFADARSKQAFFLALDDAWYRELQTRAVNPTTL